jgi:hypothetical protein
MKTKSQTTDELLTHIRTGQPLTTIEQVKEKISLTKAERFRKYAGGRTAQALRAIENLGNCANTANYEYTEHQVSTMFTELKRVLTETEAKFQPKSRAKFGRNFFQGEE